MIAAAAAVLVAGVVFVAIRDDGATDVASATAVFVDEFDDQEGAWTKDPDATIASGVYRWSITTPGQNVQVRPDAFRQQTDDMDVDVTINRIDADSIIRLRCRQSPIEAGYSYFFTLGPDNATIGVEPIDVDGAATRVVAEASFVRSTGPFTLTATCRNLVDEVALELSVDGAVVVSASRVTPTAALPRATAARRPRRERWPGSTRRPQPSGS